MSHSLRHITRVAVVLALSVCVCSQALLRIPIGVLTSKASRTSITCSVQKAPADARRDGVDTLIVLIGIGPGWSLADATRGPRAVVDIPDRFAASLRRAPLGSRPPPATL